RHALGVFAHLAECGNEMGVGFNCIGVRQFREPGKRYPVFLNLNWKFANTERLLNQATLGIQQFSKVANRRFVQRDLHCKPHSFALWRSEIGRASCRERGWVWVAGGSGEKTEEGNKLIERSKKVQQAKKGRG